MRMDLDAYVQALHKRRGFGNSLRELIDIYEYIPDHGKEVYFEDAFVSGLAQSSWIIIDIFWNDWLPQGGLSGILTDTL